VSKRFRIAIMGTRGVPAAYGGFETFAEALGARLVERGHDVTVYGRSHVVPAGLRHHRGMRLRVLPTIRHKYLDTVVHTAVSVLDGLFRRFDVVLICNNANAPFAIVPRIAGASVALNVDGLEWHREKWSRIGRWYYRACAWLSPKLPITLVTDAQVIARYYRDRFGKTTVFIPYGSDSRRLPPGPTIERLDLEASQFILYVSRFEPENHAHTVLEAYRQAGGLERLGVPLVLVGDAPYATEYRARIEDLAADTPGVVMPGYVFGDGYVELQSNALLYVQATEVGGTHPALVEAMGRGATIVANRVPEHSEVLGDAGWYYERNDATSLAAQITALVAQPETRAELAQAAAERAEAQFSWGHVTDEYEALFHRLRGGAAAVADGRAVPAGDGTPGAGRRVTLFGLDIDALTMEETLDAIDAMIAEGGIHQHVVVNVAKVVQASSDPEFRAIVNACDLVNADGQPIVWAARLLGRPLPERVTGVDLMIRLFDRAEKAGYGVYLLGARRPVVSAVVERLAQDHPGLRIVGWREGYWTEEEEEAMVEEIAAARPTILLLGIPSPAKERFLARWKERIGASFVMGVGGSFDVYGGLVRRAPQWMQRAGLEWAFRMIQEPGRMWRRYTHDGSRFLWLMIQTVARRRP
jgi:exopolysaccharide biosynthesis WecB/TagA/CpsF family protein